MPYTGGSYPIQTIQNRQQRRLQGKRGSRDGYPVPTDFRASQKTGGTQRARKGKRR